MSPDYELKLTLRTQQLTQDDNGYNVWKTIVTEAAVPATEMALLLCDVWDNHCSRGARERLEVLVPQMNEVVKAARSRGVKIIHSPASAADFYAGTPARQRMIDAPHIDPPEPLDLPDPPLPVAAPEGGSDTGEPAPPADWRKDFPVTKEHDGIEISDEDGISEKGDEVYNYLHQQGITNLIIMGIHTNMCVLERPFGIKQMVRWGLNVMLVRDITDTMYNPADPPYVSHDEGTQLVIAYIEKFWCPTISNDDLMATA